MLSLVMLRLIIDFLIFALKQKKERNKSLSTYTFPKWKVVFELLRFSKHTSFLLKHNCWTLLFISYRKLNSKALAKLKFIALVYFDHNKMLVDIYLRMCFLLLLESVSKSADNAFKSRPSSVRACLRNLDFCT